MPYLYAETKEQLLARLGKIEGQIRGIARMVESDKYCVDILTQITAVTGALDKVGLSLLRDHIKGCVAEGGPEKADELVDVVHRFLKT
jgi:DNA-binding FrmR family transcriptional regulator